MPHTSPQSSQCTPLSPLSASLSPIAKPAFAKSSSVTNTMDTPLATTQLCAAPSFHHILSKTSVDGPICITSSTTQHCQHRLPQPSLTLSDCSDLSATNRIAVKALSSGRSGHSCPPCPPQIEIAVNSSDNGRRPYMTRLSSHQTLTRNHQGTTDEFHNGHENDNSNRSMPSHRNRAEMNANAKSNTAPPTIHAWASSSNSRFCNRVDDKPNQTNLASSPCYTVLKPQRSKKVRSSKSNIPGTSRYWTPSEHKLFIEALLKYGPKDLKSISTYVSTRNMIQCRTHEQKCFMRLMREAQRDTMIRNGELSQSNCSLGAPLLKLQKDVYSVSPDCGISLLCAVSEELTRTLQQWMTTWSVAGLLSQQVCLSVF